MQVVGYRVYHCYHIRVAHQPWEHQGEVVPQREGVRVGEGKRDLQGSGFRVQGSGFRVQGSGFRVQGSGFRVQGAGFRVQGPGFRVQGSGFRVQGSGFRVQGSGFTDQHGCAGLPRRQVEREGCRAPDPCSGFRDQGSGFRVQGSGFRVQGGGRRAQGVGCRVQGAPATAASGSASTSPLAALAEMRMSGVSRVTPSSGTPSTTCLKL